MFSYRLQLCEMTLDCLICNRQYSSAYRRQTKEKDLMLDSSFPLISAGSLSLKVSDSYRVMMDDVKKTDKMFGVVMSDGKGQFCEVGTAVENVKQEILKGRN